MDQTVQTRNNLASNIVTLVISIAVGLFYTPYLVRNLGIAAYGIVPLALIINQYISVITGSITASLTRFYSVALQKENFSEASRYLSSAFVAIGALVIVLAPLFVLIVMRIERIFNIPAGYVAAARILFIFTLVSFVLSLFSSLLNVTLYALNRLDLMNNVKIVRTGFKVVCTVIFFEAIQKDVAYIGYANFLTEAANVVLSYYYYRKVTAGRVKFVPRLFERAALASILSMTVWTIVHQLGDTGLYRIDNIMVNIFWSTRESGILGAVSEFGSYVMTLVSVVGSLFGPLILIAYGKEDHAAVKQLAMDNSLFVGAATALLVGFLIGFAKPIIGLWLGAEYSAYSHWFIMKQITLPFYAAAGVYAFVYRAWNRVMFPALFTLVVGVLNLVVSYAICSMSGGSERYILFMLIAAACCIVVQSYGLNVFCFWRIYPDLAAKKIFSEFFKITLILACTSAATFAFSTYIEMRTPLQLGMGMAAAAIVCGAAVFYTIFDPAHRSTILNYLPSFKHAS
jgi:membrane protein EpsK